MEWKHTDAPVKKTFQEQLSINKVMLTVFYDIKRHNSVDFVEKFPTPYAQFALFIE